MIALFRWRGHTVSMDAPQPLIERVAELSGVTHETCAAAEKWHVQAEAHRLVSTEFGEYSCETPSDLLATAANLVPALLLAQADGHVLHAAAIVKDGQAHLLLGPRRAGKSTLALEAWIAGFTVAGDDVVLVDPVSGTIEATPRPMKIRQPDAALPARLAGRVPDADWAAGRVLGEQALILGRRLPGMAPLGERYQVGRVLLVERSEDSHTHSLPVDKYAAMAAIMEQEMTPSKGLGLLKGLLGRVAGRQVFRLQVGRDNPADALSRIPVDSPV
jgi:hypothetical protein